MRKVILTPELVHRVHHDGRFQAASVADPGRAWRADGACAHIDDPDVFFPTEPEDLAPARRACRSCPVAGECLAEALARPEIDGVWGGTSTAERRAMRAVWRRDHVAALVS